MRKKIAAGNWKMNLDLAGAEKLAREIAAGIDAAAGEGVEAILAPPFPFLQAVGQIIAGRKNLRLSAQNLHQAPSGAHTGEVAGAMLRTVGCQAVIVGHSERRQYFGETNALLAEKVKQAIAERLLPIYCLGETLEQREAGKTFEVVETQLREGALVFDEGDFRWLTIAYEPVWAIGTGKTATPEQAQEVHAFLRDLIRKRYGAGAADVTSILYGGSVKPGNAAELFARPDIDGGLVGGASLKSADFLEVVRALG